MSPSVQRVDLSLVSVVGAYCPRNISSSSQVTTSIIEIIRIVKIVGRVEILGAHEIIIALNADLVRDLADDAVIVI